MLNIVRESALIKKHLSCVGTVSGPGAEAVRTEGGSRSASEETVFHRQRRRATIGSPESRSPARLQRSEPAELPSRAAVRTQRMHRSLLLISTLIRAATNQLFSSFD